MNWDDILGDAEDWQLKKAEDLEERTVNRLLRALGVNPRQLQDFVRGSGGTGSRVTWAHFHAVYADFEIYFGARRIPNQSASKLLQPKNILTTFEKSPIWQEFKQFLEQHRLEAGNRPMAMIFGFPGYQAGLVIHTNDLPYSYGTVWCHRVRNKRAELTVWVEPYLRLIQAIQKQRFTLES